MDTPNTAPTAPTGPAAHPPGGHPADALAARAAAAHAELRRRPTAYHGRLLHAVADRIDAVGPDLVSTAHRETNLPEPGLTAELARTVRQLRMFADLAADGSHTEPVVDRADPAARPPRPDLRRMLVGIGPVAVFGAGNFPLAFGAAGGDTASALAAGCPVVCRPHPLHPRTARLTAAAVLAGLRDAGAPDGTFALLPDPALEAGRRLVTADPIRAVAFTGSSTGGRALFDLAAARPDPIPVYAEMGSVNPVVLLSDALARRGEEIARGLAASLTTGYGQLCTSPGVVLLPAGAGDFATRLLAALDEAPAGRLLSPDLARRLTAGLAELAALRGVVVLRDGTADDDGAFTTTVLGTDTRTFTEHPSLREEYFGPATVLVRYDDPAALPAVLRALPPGLTVTVHGDAEAELVDAAVQQAGRVVFDGFPTGVAVSPAMTHGGPYPATTSVLHTAVGPTAVRRFLRPVTYQNAPRSALPPELRDDRPASPTSRENPPCA
ncbi:aldehyde dehydrogenase (NADP(+)) [Kitasatospora sp. NPDC088351]|uniref:aldehyde dehydrogenase (NADP(+)) n=1 Tax=unclassified Kitasatospora TaxID=2633591 RepID=UPI003427E696